MERHYKINSETYVDYDALAFHDVAWAFKLKEQWSIVALVDFQLKVSNETRKNRKFIVQILVK